MKPRNPLQALLRVRSVKERQARAELGSARSAQEAARERLEEMKEQYRDRAPIHELLTPHQLRVLQLQGVRSVEMLHAAAAAYEEARRHTESRADRWRKAAVDVDAAEKLEAKRREQAAAAARTAAERSLDDMMMLLRARRAT